MIVGIDYGISKVGIAVIDEKARSPALPVTVIKIHPGKFFSDTFSKIIEDYTPTEIVIGDPFTAFFPSKDDRIVFEKFIQLIEKLAKQKPTLYEEAGTTREAQHLIKSHPQKIKDDDAIAASIMLEAYVLYKKNASVS